MLAGEHRKMLRSGCAVFLKDMPRQSMQLGTGESTCSPGSGNSTPTGVSALNSGGA